MRYMPILGAFTIGFVQGSNPLSGWRNLLAIGICGLLVTAMQIWNLSLQEKYREEQRP